MKDAFSSKDKTGKKVMNTHLTTGNYFRDIVNHSAFKGFGELLLPRDDNSGYYNTSLADVRSLMPYHGYSYVGSLHEGFPLDKPKQFI